MGAVAGAPDYLQDPSQGKVGKEELSWADSWVKVDHKLAGLFLQANHGGTQNRAGLCLGQTTLMPSPIGKALEERGGKLCWP